MGTKKSSRRSVEEVERLVSGYQRSGLTRREYCLSQGITVTTLDYYRRQKRPKSGSTNLLPVQVEAAPVQSAGERGFALVLVNGRRIESPWSFGEAELTRLIRTAERV